MKVATVSKSAVWPRQGEDGFRTRCEAALTHPATIASLALLLLNDLVFKPLWPGSWATGKLSDLGWMIFAPPLLAFLLSFLAGRSSHRQRATLLASYVGLPLLYGAYNSFEAVHIAILKGLSIASGGTAGSPLDVSDSLVIPTGLVVALWVWRQGTSSPDTLRLRCGLLVAGVAALASVATSYPEPDLGIRELGVSKDGTIHGGYWGRSSYHSKDGGMTWDSSYGVTAPPSSIEWGEKSVETPRGMYAIRGPEIIKSDTAGSRQVVYTTAFMQEDGNVWVQEHATSQLEAREITTEPHSMVYDAKSGNLVAAMGIQGVFVGSADGSWTAYSVGPYSLVDFSLSGKTKQLLSNGHFWTMAVALSLSMCGIALAASRYRRSEIRVLVATLLFALALLVGLPALLVGTGQGRLVEQLFLGGATSPMFLFVALIGGAIGVAFLPRENLLRKNAGLLLGILALVGSGALVFGFGGSNADPTGVYPLMVVILAIPAYVLSLLTLVVSGEYRSWPIVIVAFVGMLLLAVLAFMLWLHQGIGMTLTKASAIALTGLAAAILFGYLKRTGDTSQEAEQT